MCVKPQMRSNVCQALPLPNTKCVCNVCHQMRSFVCHQMRLLMQRSSLRSLTFARSHVFLTI